MVAMIVSLSELGPHHRGLDGDQPAEGDQHAPLAAAASAEDSGTETFLAREECVPTQGKKVDGPLLREGDRGTADPQPDQPILGSNAAPTD